MKNRYKLLIGITLIWVTTYQLLLDRESESSEIPTTLLENTSENAQDSLDIDKIRRLNDIPNEYTSHEVIDGYVEIPNHTINNYYYIKPQSKTRIFHTK